LPWRPGPWDLCIPGDDDDYDDNGDDKSTNVKVQNFYGGKLLPQNSCNNLRPGNNICSRYIFVYIW